jgi:hypothetical protein
MAAANQRGSCGNESRPHKYNAPSGVAIPNGAPDCTEPARTAGADRLTPLPTILAAAEAVNEQPTNPPHVVRVPFAGRGANEEARPSRLGNVSICDQGRGARVVRWLFAAGVVCRRAR